ncbi:hypothetical protein [Polaromonas sp. YR568]
MHPIHAANAASNPLRTNKEHDFRPLPVHFVEIAGESTLVAP